MRDESVIEMRFLKLLLKKNVVKIGYKYTTHQKAFTRAKDTERSVLLNTNVAKETKDRPVFVIYSISYIVPRLNKSRKS